MFSKLGRLAKTDFVKGLIVAILTTPLTIIYETLNAGSIDIDWRKVLTVAITGGLGYLLKNLLTGSKGRFLTND